jgi:decaprenyl-phosphate phosphoribosyltransferase
MNIQTVGAVGPMAGLLRSARPLQWIKNLLVFAAPGAAGVLLTSSNLGISLVVFLAFCLAASGTYFWNDIADLQADQAHPIKRYRPIAAGQVSLGLAKGTGTSLLIAGPLLLVGLQLWTALAILLGYIVLTLAYSVWFKHVAVLDLVVIASGFVLRAAAGAVAVSVSMSGWFLLFIIFGALFVVTGKRYAEMANLAADPLAPAMGSTRGTLATYRAGYLRDVMVVNCGGAILTYCLWAFEARRDSGGSLIFYELSILPVIVAMFRYLLILDLGMGSAPEEVLTRDRVLQISGLAWILIFTLAVYLT